MIKQTRHHLPPLALMPPIAFSIAIGVLAMPLPAEASLIKTLRQWLGYNPPLATGGSRSATDGDSESRLACLVSPRFSAADNPGEPNQRAQKAEVREVYLRQPTIQSATELQEWTLIDASGTVLANNNAPYNQPLPSTIAWPLPPLQPNQVVKLELRPIGAGGLDTATITLIAASKAKQEQAEELLEHQDRPQVIRQLLQNSQSQRSNPRLALELIFAPLDNLSSSAKSEIEAWRSEIIKAGCKG